MTVTVSCMGHSGAYFPGGGGRQELSFTLGENIEALLGRLGVSTDLFMYAIVNGERRDLLYRLEERDDVVLVSPIMGG